MRVLSRLDLVGIENITVSGTNVTLTLTNIPPLSVNFIERATPLDTNAWQDVFSFFTFDDAATNLSVNETNSEAYFRVRTEE